MIIQDFVSNEKAEPAAAQMTWQKKRYWERKNNHLCVVCGKQNETDKALCPECRAKKNEYYRKNTKFYASLHLCTRCGKNRTFGEEKICPECRAIKATAQSLHGLTDEQKKNRYARRCRRYHERLQQGICTLCGRRSAVEGRAKCGICAAKSRERQREYQNRRKTGIPRTERVQNGLCYTCGSRLDREGKAMCSRCESISRKNLEKARGCNAYWKKDDKMIYLKRTETSCDVATGNARKIFHASPYANAFTCK